jgi:hypothetical protein
MKAGMPMHLEAAAGDCWRVLLILRDMPGTTELVPAYCPLAFTRKAQVHEGGEGIKDMYRGKLDSCYVFTGRPSMKTISQLRASIEDIFPQYL